MKIFKTTNELNYHMSRDGKNVHYTNPENNREIIKTLSSSEILGDLTNITPLLFSEISEEVKPGMMPDYDKLYIQTWGDGWEAQNGPAISSSFDTDYDTEFSEPKLYSEWISKKISEMSLRIRSLSDEQFDVNCQECYQCIDSEAVLVGFDVFKNAKNEEDIELEENFSLIGIAIPFDGRIYANNEFDYPTKIEIENINNNEFDEEEDYHCGTHITIARLYGGGFGDLLPWKFKRFEGGFYDTYNKEVERTGGNVMEIRLD